MIDASLLASAATLLRVVDHRSPSEFAREHIWLSEKETALHGPWSSEVFPFLDPVMDAVEEALETGKRGVVLMKAGQIGGSRAILNALCWLKARHSGAILYMTSTHETAKEFARIRLSREVIERCRPLDRKALFGRGVGELVQIKRFVDGAIVMVGGKSITAYESTPYPFVVVDEYDSIQDELKGRGDPLANVEIRMDGYKAMGSRTLAIAFAHPTTKSRGVGRIYYDLSDQRRAFSRCLHCDAGDFWLDWDAQVRVEPERGEAHEKAERDPRRYVWRAPCCGHVVSDADRVVMAASTVQRSVLSPDEAASRRWIGLHVSQFYARHHPLEELAAQWIEGLDRESARRVFVNKRAGDVYANELATAGVDDWQACIATAEVGSAYGRGLVPDEAQYLTAGTDHRGRELHWTVWAWGHIRDAHDLVHLMGWLVDWGIVDVGGASDSLDAADLVPFDEAIYDRSFLRQAGDGALRVLQGEHDAGWERAATYGYCLRRLQMGDARARPCKGAAVRMSSSSTTPPWSPGQPPSWEIGGETLRYPRPLLLLNTFTIKQIVLSKARREVVRKDGRRHRLMALPCDVGEDVILEHLAAERLTVNDRGDLYWDNGKRQNHYLDASVYAMAAALQLQPAIGGMTRDDRQERQERAREQARTRAATAAGQGRRPVPSAGRPRAVRRRYGG